MYNYPCFRDQYIPQHTPAYSLFTIHNSHPCVSRPVRVITTDIDSAGSYFTRLFTMEMIHFTAHLRPLALHGFTGAPLWVPA